MKGKTAIIASIAIIAIALGFLVFSGLSQNMVYYFHVDEFLTKASGLAGETVKVNGKVVKGSIQKNQMDYRFVIHGMDESNRVQVSYHGVVPDTFKDNSDVVVEGVYDQNAREFRAYTLMAKCPTKYEPQEGEQNQVTQKR